MHASEIERVRLFRERGYFVLRGFLGERQRGELRRACDLALERAREASTAYGHDTPNIALFSSAEHFASEPALLEGLVAFVASARVCALFRGLAAPSTSAPDLKGMHYYHEQSSRDWDGDWHRDSQFGRSDPDVERAVALTTTALHFRVALAPDDRLEIVPGSHARWDTPEELTLRKGSARSSSSMPNAERVELAAGDACVFHAWSIHRATYRRFPERRTLDCLYHFEPPNPPRVWTART
jgi:hypothetical protein